MPIKDVKPNTGSVTLVAEVIKKDSPRSFEKFGKSGRVCNAILKDATGSITLTLWNDDVDKVKVGDTIKLENGWCSEYKGERQVSTGKLGRIEVMEGSQKEVFTNDPGVMQQEEGIMGEEDASEETFDEEEIE